MSHFISERQFQRENRPDLPVPLILPSQGLSMKHRKFPEEFEYHSLLLDVYEVRNTSSSGIPYLLMPTSCTQLAFPVIPAAAKPVLIGPQILLKRILLPPGAVVFFARFRPGGGEWLLKGIDPAYTAGNVFPLGGQFLPEVNAVLRSMRRGESWHERLLMLLRFLEVSKAAAYRPFPLAGRCLEKILERRGQVQVQELAKVAGCSERYLNMVFTSHVGLSVKPVCQIIQIHFALGSILEKQPRSLLETAVECGFFDQTHMNRFFRKYLGGTANDMRYAQIRSRCASDLGWTL